MRKLAFGSLCVVLAAALAVLPLYGDSDSSTLFDLRVECLRRLGAIPSFSACIIKGDAVVWQGQWGWADVYRSVPATEETQYLIGSVSKMFTAVAILQLAEQDPFDLDDDVNAFLPFNLRNPSCPDLPITFRMLLCHHAGLAMENEHFFSTFYFRPYNPSELEAVLTPANPAFRPTYWLDLCPGERMEYANIGYELLAYLVERISGEPFADYVDKHIFGPLGMETAVYDVSEAFSPAMPYVTFLGIPIPMGQYEIGSHGAGGIRTSLSDLSQFVIALMNGGACGSARILSPSSVAKMQTVQYPGHVSQDFEYGLGWSAYTKSEYGGHAGGAFGGRAMARVRMSDKTAIIYAFNRLNPMFPPSATPLLTYTADRLETILWRLAETLHLAD